jgi:hypothetical protein
MAANIAGYLFGLLSPFRSKIGKSNFAISSHVVTGRLSFPPGLLAIADEVIE